MAVAVKWRKSVQNIIKFISKCLYLQLSRLNWFLTNYFNLLLLAIDNTMGRDTVLPIGFNLRLKPLINLAFSRV
ncbi:MAG: hypothetical protein EAZ25_11425 [Oscillatoriales cyanobacterium]|nr:MAG: hypothetical protein EAZ88_01030 [Oscillatoriales cyanobacterium]TAG00898.1 MAG: hypothetical protein EAZ45_14430 [Oscillatoriales cyanobacterium]TAG33840.1 MAG: hypothetical protein EAZ33_29070 [Oscillatoriales cyanobacterium]TAG53289.1 MAG: hypothetical protein EAZ28_27745 [Oscillatoriales cyanobacterium]TAG66550.1 MAG: hypothetical protein EAZ25_11425 [Oscillatoriales cyanobacterium]